MSASLMDRVNIQRMKKDCRVLNVASAVLTFVLGLVFQLAASSVAQGAPLSDISYLEADAGSANAYRREMCRLDMDIPQGTSNFATVIWFHGGSLTSGKRGIPPELQGQGFAVLAPDYRLSPKAKAPAYIEDAAAAVAWAFRHIAEYGGDPARIYLSGHSAGGYLASMVALDKRYLARYGINANQIAGVVPFSGQAITHFTVRAERGILKNQAVVDDLAPLFYVRKDAPPFLLITGDRDKELLGRYEENAYFWRMLKVSGHQQSDLIELKGYDHGGMIEPAMPLLIKYIKKGP